MHLAASHFEKSSVMLTDFVCDLVS